MRLFIGINFPEEIIRYVTEVQKQLLIGDFFEGKLISANQLHLTLKFIGEVTQEQSEQIQKLLHTISMEPFQVCIGSLGVLPSPEKIHIIWIDLLGEKLKQLAASIENVLSPIVPKENRPFLSHVTLARVKRVHNSKKLLERLSQISLEQPCFTVNSFTLYQSILSSEGSEYRVIEQILLK